MAWNSNTVNVEGRETIQLGPNCPNLPWKMWFLTLIEIQTGGTPNLKPFYLHVYNNFTLMSSFKFSHNSINIDLTNHGLPKRHPHHIKSHLLQRPPFLRQAVEQLTYLYNLWSWKGIFRDFSQVEPLAEHWAVQISTQHTNNHLQNHSLGHSITVWIASLLTFCWCHHSKYHWLICQTWLNQHTSNRPVSYMALDINCRPPVDIEKKKKPPDIQILITPGRQKWAHFPGSSSSSA